MSSILVSQEAGVLTITLNRPEKLNAFNPEMHQLLRKAIERATDDADIRALLLTGAGRGFCAGQDLAARSASFVQSFSRLGLVPDSGGAYFLPRPVGTARAMGLALLGEKLSAEDAERWGLIWKAVDDGKLLAEANGLARTLAAGPTKGYGLIKKAIYASAGNSLDAQLDLERDLQREAGFSEDYREGVSAFMDKREPRYQGK